jgi:hypothetical protein
MRRAGRAREAVIDVILDITGWVPNMFGGFVGTLDEATRQSIERPGSSSSNSAPTDRKEARSRTATLAKQHPT